MAYFWLAVLEPQPGLGEGMCGCGAGKVSLKFKK